MWKALLTKLFGAGQPPVRLAETLQSEGIVLIDEGIKGSVTYIDFRAPGRYSSWRRQWYRASIALTETRLFALRSASTLIDVPLRDERLHRMRFSVEESGTFLVAFDASLFHADWSGTIEYRFKTEQAQLFLQKLQGHSV